MRRRIILVSAALLTTTVAVTAFYRNSAGAAGPGLTTAPITRGDVVETVGPPARSRR